MSDFEILSIMLMILEIIVLILLSNRDKRKKK